MSKVFPKAKRLTLGYDPEEVNEFFVRAREAYEGGDSAREFSAIQVRSAAFKLKRGGYATEAVDSALDRLEVAFIKRDRANHVAVNGQQAWLDHVADWATSLYPRLLRPQGERFAHPEKGKGYQVQAVDKFMERIAAVFDEGASITAEEIKSVTFPAARKGKAYDEGPVDAYLARTTEIILAVE